MDNPELPRSALRLAVCFGAICALGGWFASAVPWASELELRSLCIWTTGGFGALIGYALGAWLSKPGGSWGALVLSTICAGSANALTLLVLLSLDKPFGDRSSLAAVPTLAMFAVAFGAVTSLLFLPPLAIVFGAHAARRRSRPLSIVDRVEGASVWFRTALVICIASILGSTSTDRTTTRVLGIVAIAALGAMLVVVVDGVIHRHRAGRLRAGLRPADGTVDETPSIDLGLGDEVWTSADEQSTHYRLSARATTTVVGSFVTANRALGHATLVRGLWLLAAGASFVFVETAKRDATPAPAPRAAVGASAAVATDGGHTSWYPQPNPILIDLDGDGIEDIVGLRWNAQHADAALSIVATNGATFRTLWATAALKSQWASPRTHLVMSKGAFFLTDSEGMLHVYDSADGRLTSEMKLPARDGWTAEICGSPDSANAWIRDDYDYAHVSQGTLVSRSGRSIELTRPAWCRHDARYGRACGTPGEGACRSNEGVGSKRSDVATGPSFEEDDLGVDLASAKGPTGSYLVGYDPKTRATRWERELAFDGTDLHASPQIETLLGHGRLHSRYQEKSGRWILGARDARTGVALWSREVPRALHGANFDSMTITGQRLYVAVDWHVDVFDPATGTWLGST